MRERGEGGAIVNILSINAHCGTPELAVYSATKGALATLTRNAANAHRFDRIRVNGINVGWTDTPAERVMQAETLGHGAGWIDEANAALPFGRLFAAEDVANLAVFLLSRCRRPDDRRADRPGAVGGRGEPVSARRRRRTLGPAHARPAAAGGATARPTTAPTLRAGMAHIGVGAFHRCHQAEYTDDLLGAALRPLGRRRHQHPRRRASPTTLGRQDGLYTRLIREDDRVEARVIGSIVAVVDSQDSAEPALDVLASPDIDVVTHDGDREGLLPPARRAASSTSDHPDIVHDLANPEAPRSVPGLIAAGARTAHADAWPPAHAASAATTSRPTARSSASVVRALAERRGDGLSDWIAGQRRLSLDHGRPHRAGDHAGGHRRRSSSSFGYRDDAVVVGEPFRQWVIENRFAGRIPRMGSRRRDLRRRRHAVRASQDAGAQRRADDACLSRRARRPRAHLRRHGRSAACRLRPPHADRGDAADARCRCRASSADAYVEQSLARLRNTAIRHRNHQIATDGSQKIVQRLLNPIRERLRRGEQHRAAVASPSPAGWSISIRASERFGEQLAGRRSLRRRGSPRSPIASATMPRRSLPAILAHRHDLRPRAGGERVVPRAVVDGLDGLLSADPMAYRRTRLQSDRRD